MILNQNEQEERLHGLIETMGSQLMQYISDNSITGIFLNSDGQIWVKSSGIISNVGYMAELQRYAILCKVADLNNTVINEYNADLSGSIILSNRLLRVQGSIPPITKGSSITIRLHNDVLLSLDSYIEDKLMTQTQYDKLICALKEEKNILIAGGMNSGKTTLLNSLLLALYNIKPNLRCMILEDTAEIKCKLPNTEYLKSDAKNSLNDLLVSTLRREPDRIVIGEVRTGIVALELLKSCNIGHKGLLTTIHANSANKALDRLEELLLEVSQNNMNKLVNNGIDVVVYMQNRFVQEILET
ncbi:MAG: Type secretion system protein PtlH [Pseudomonadota bacterium]|jgi:type IV secretion system protein VirB11